jgi:hypothetical protein
METNVTHINQPQVTKTICIGRFESRLDHHSLVAVDFGEDLSESRLDLFWRRVRQVWVDVGCSQVGGMAATGLRLMKSNAR